MGAHHPILITSPIKDVQDLLNSSVHVHSGQQWYTNLLFGIESTSKEPPILILISNIIVGLIYTVSPYETSDMKLD
jgi:hypothetical protein